jgi:hypothetical protein
MLNIRLMQYAYSQHMCKFRMLYLLNILICSAYAYSKFLMHILTILVSPNGYAQQKGKELMRMLGTRKKVGAYA